MLHGGVLLSWGLGPRVRKSTKGYTAFSLFPHSLRVPPFGFVEGLNNKIREWQRRAYGFQDEEYLRLKILTCMLPKLQY